VKLDLSNNDCIENECLLTFLMDFIAGFEICFENMLNVQKYHHCSFLENKKNTAHIILKQKAPN